MRTTAQRKRLPNWAIGLILIVILAIASVYAFTKAVPWSNPYTVKAVFPSASNIRPASPVRIAGVNVGKVTEIEHLDAADATEVLTQAGTSDDQAPSGGEPSSATVVTMELEESALPLHTDATMKLRPRLFLEGNLFVDLKPGTPNEEVADDGYVFPISQTAVAVQLDQVFTTLQSDVRSNLQILLDEFGTAFRRGGAEGFREIYRTSPGAFRYTAEVNDALLGTEEHDLSELIVNLDSTVKALNQGSDIQDLITNLRTVLGSFAAESENLEQAIALLPDVLREGEPALASLNSSFPALRAFAREALPGVRSTPATLDAATPLLAQVRGLVSRPELRGLVADLRPAIPDLAALAQDSVPVLNETRALSSCFNEVIIPFGYQQVNDPETPASGQIYEELGYGLVGISGESRSGDANGPYIRVQAGGGPNTVTYPNSYQTATGLVDAVGLTSAPLEGGIPAIEDSAKTPFRPGVPCERQDPPNLEASVFDLSPFVNTASSPIVPRQASEGLASAAEDATEQFDLVNELFAKGRTARGQEVKADAMDAVNEELAKLYDLEFLLNMDAEDDAP
jgi:phospholipid/cholesterol/gamma-HCH transport system substrate-binding protein